MKVSDENPARITLVGTKPKDAQAITTRIPGRYSLTSLKIHITTADHKIEEKIITSLARLLVAREKYVITGTMIDSNQPTVCA